MLVTFLRRSGLNFEQFLDFVACLDEVDDEANLLSDRVLELYETHIQQLTQTRAAGLD